MLRDRERSHRKLKICAVGEEAVGKTSLIRRFVADTFSPDYIKTVGTHLSKKSLTLEDPEWGAITVDAIIWDIMGRKSFSDLLNGAHFTGARGIFAVCDITRRETLGKLHAWLVKIFSYIGVVPVAVMVNKSDLHDQHRISEADIYKITKTYGAPYFFTSAKTGDSVPAAFEGLLKTILEKQSPSLELPE